MKDVDVQQFWKDEQIAGKDPFGRDIPQTALGIRMSKECVFTELGEPGEQWGDNQPARMAELAKRYNDRAERIVGRRLLSEDVPDLDRQFPPLRPITEVFEAKRVWAGGSWWVTESADNPQELAALLDRVEALDLRGAILPPNWEQEKRRLWETYGLKPPLFRGLRGPVTLATSIYGAERLIYLIADDPGLARRFSRVIGDVILGMAAVTDQEAGYTPDDAPHGFGFCDDNTCLLNPEMYELFGYPILKRVFDRYSPDPGDRRYLHADSPMAHNLPILGRLNLTRVNFGPTVLVPHIRPHLPNAIIDGCLAPFTFMSNDEDAIIAEVRRDCDAARDRRGLRVDTAGSINDGSLLTSMRAVMYAVQRYGRFD